MARQTISDTRCEAYFEAQSFAEDIIEILEQDGHVRVLEDGYLQPTDDDLFINAFRQYTKEFKRSLIKTLKHSSFDDKLIERVTKAIGEV